MNAVQERDERIDDRADLYRWFSSVFAREQDRASWELQTSPEFLELLEERAAAFELGEGAAALAEYLGEHAEGDLDELLLTLAVDYAQLFIGPGPGQAPPFESVYTSEDGRLYGDAYAKVVETLHREGIAVDKTFSAPADHVAVELAVMAHLIDRVSEGAELPAGADPEADAAFLASHVLPWFPRWLAQVEAHAKTPFYRAAGRMLTSFLAGERARGTASGPA